MVAATVMVVAMADLAYTALVPPVVWSGALLIVGLCLAVFLRTRSSVSRAEAVPRTRDEWPGRPTGGRGRRLRSVPQTPSLVGRGHGCLTSGPSAVVLCAMAYPVMAWQVLNHGAHMAVRHMPAAMGIMPATCRSSARFSRWPVILAACLVVCAIHDIARRRPVVSLDCWGMAAMIVVMQFLTQLILHVEVEVRMRRAARIESGGALRAGV
jgi:hypothetical protein